MAVWTERFCRCPIRSKLIGCQAVRLREGVAISSGVCAGRRAKTARWTLCRAAIPDTPSTPEDTGILVDGGPSRDVHAWCGPGFHRLISAACPRCGCGELFWYVGVCRLPREYRLLKHCLRMVDWSTFSGKQCLSARLASLALHRKQWHTQHLSPPKKRTAHPKMPVPRIALWDNPGQARVIFVLCGSLG